MTRAFLFDFHRTLVVSEPWIALEIRGLPRAALTRLAAQGLIQPLSPEAFIRAEVLFAETRVAAETTGVETNHIDDLLYIAAGMGLEGKVTRTWAEETVAGLHRACVETAQLLPGAAEMLHGLKDRGYRLGIISNAAYSDFLTWTLARFELSGLFEQVVVSCDVGARKPWPQIFHISLERMGLAAADCVYVGDDYLKDIVAPRRVGMQAIWYRPEGELLTPGIEAADGPTAVVTALDQIIPWARREDGASRRL